jgi:hypothetical protein
LPHPFLLDRLNWIFYVSNVFEYPFFPVDVVPAVVVVVVE